MKSNLRQAFLLQELGQRIVCCPVCNKKYRYWNEGHANATCGDMRCIEKLVKSGKCSIKSPEYRKYMEYCAEKVRNDGK